MPVGSSGQSEVLKQHFTLSEIMYYIGGGIVFLGICVLAYQNWDNFSSFLRIFVTLGSLWPLVVGSLLYRYENLKKISQAFFLIAGCLAPLALNNCLWNGDGHFGRQFASINLFNFNQRILGSLWFFRQTILLFFGIVFATALFHF